MNELPANKLDYTSSPFSRNPKRHKEMMTPLCCLPVLHGSRSELANEDKLTVLMLEICTHFVLYLNCSLKYVTRLNSTLIVVFKEYLDIFWSPVAVRFASVAVRLFGFQGARLPDCQYERFRGFARAPPSL